MILIKETQNYIELDCRECDEYTDTQILKILEDMNIDGDEALRSCKFDVWYDVGYDSDSSYRWHTMFTVSEEDPSGQSQLYKALNCARTLNNAEVTGRLLFKKPDPMKSVIDNVNLNLETAYDKLKNEL